MCSVWYAELEIEIDTYQSTSKSEFNIVHTCRIREDIFLAHSKLEKLFVGFSIQTLLSPTTARTHRAVAR